MLALLGTRRIATLCACVVTLLSAASLAATDRPADTRDHVGIVHRARGQVQIERNGVLIKDVTAGHTLARRDQLSTGPGSRVILSFKDGSQLAVGENAQLVIADFMREEGRRSGALILDLIRGAIRLVAAKPKEAPTKRVEVRTTAATISSRGVDVWSSCIGDKLAVLVLKGKVDVRNDAGLVILDRKRLGTFVADRLSAPEKPSVWPKARAQESLLAVAFR